MSIKKAIYLVAGCISAGLGAVGTVVPMLPSFPFLMLALFCFARSSRKLERRFKETRLYKNNLESYVQGRQMTWKSKLRIMITVTLLMGIGFTMMSIKPMRTGRNVLVCIWAFHILYFVWGVKTLKSDKAADHCDP